MNSNNNNNKRFNRKWQTTEFEKAAENCTAAKIAFQAARENKKAEPIAFEEAKLRFLQAKQAKRQIRMSANESNETNEASSSDNSHFGRRFHHHHRFHQHGVQGNKKWQTPEFEKAAENCAAAKIAFQAARENKKAEPNAFGEAKLRFLQAKQAKRQIRMSANKSNEASGSDNSHFGRQHQRFHQHGGQGNKK